MNTPEQDQDAYRAKCEFYRNGNKVYSTKDNSVVFDGSKGRQKHQGLGINAAKRFVSKNCAGRSFTVK